LAKVLLVSENSAARPLLARRLADLDADPDPETKQLVADPARV
jgi:hypothetical protein